MIEGEVESKALLGDDSKIQHSRQYTAIMILGDRWEVQGETPLIVAIEEVEHFWAESVFRSCLLHLTESTEQRGRAQNWNRLSCAAESLRSDGDL